MKRKLYDHDGIEVTFHGHGDGKVTIQESIADVSPLLDANARRYDGDRMARRKSDMRHVAAIDPVTFTKWIREEGLTVQQVADPVIMDRLLRKKLNNIENQKFRVGPERL